MSAAGLPGLLGRLQQGLEGLLSCLETEPFPERPVLDAAWSEVERGFDAVRERLNALEPAHPELAGARQQVEHCLRLQAVASSLLVDQREKLVREREACASARQNVRRIQARGECGGSCDVRG